MKTLKNISILMTLFLLFVNCNDDLNEKNKSSKNLSIDSNKILEQMTADKNYKIINGNFVVWQTEDNEIVAVNTNADERNMFILQGATKDIDLKDGNYEILYLKHSLLLQNKDTGENVYLKVPKPEEKIITLSVKKNINLQNEIEGIGLIYETLPIKQNQSMRIDVVKKQPSIIEFLTATTNTTNIDGDCSSGGTGSSSCSNNNCSVSCQSGYYACCNLLCDCKPNPDSDPVG